MKCIRCRRELSEQARFCPDCGLKIEIIEDAGAEVAPASSDLPYIPPLPVSPSLEKNSEEAFVPASFDQITVNPANTSPMASAAVPSPVPGPMQLPGTAPLPAAQGFAASAIPSGYGASPVLVTQNYPIDESDYYRFDATEKYDFEAFRGVSIVLMAFSALTVFGIIFPLPICIVTLVFSCMGVNEKDPRQAKSRFKICKILTIISIFAVIALLIGIYVLRYLMNY